MTEVGNVTVSVFMGPDGIGHAYGYEGMTAEAAVGYLTVTLDRLRNELSYAWEAEAAGEGVDLSEVRCQNCGEPIFDEDEHDHEDGED